MKKNIKHFTFENDLIKAAKTFIKGDIAKNGNLNFSNDYIEAMDEYRKHLCAKFCGKKFQFNVMWADQTEGESATNWTPYGNHTFPVNFGDTWEIIAGNVLAEFRLANEYKNWPNGKAYFPDFREANFIGDFKTIKTDFLKKSLDENGNNYLSQGGAFDLMEYHEYRDAINRYLAVGKLDEHLTALITACIYRVQKDEFGNETYYIENVICLPAIFMLQMKTGDKLIKTRKTKITCGMYPQNIDNIKNLAASIASTPEGIQKYYDSSAA